MPYVGVKSPQIIEEPIKRKKDNNEKELRRQGNVGRNDCWKEIKKKAFLDEQTQSRDARIAKLELKLSEEKIARKEVRRS
jgi:hypothetical protein